MFLVLWEFEVKPEGHQRFEQIYGSNGEWVQLFACDGNFHKTILWQDLSRSNVYLTMDFWHSSEAYESFKQSKREEYQLLDRACESLTVTERYLGAFDQV
jgi:heme-degrading monooxygenase HmoA